LRTSPQIHRVTAGRDVLDSLREDGAGEDGCGGSAVSSDFIRFAGDILEEAGTKVLKFVLKRDSLGDRDTIYAIYVSQKII